MSKAMDQDVKALKMACRALEQSTSTRMIVVNLHFLWGRYVMHPPDKAWWVRADAERPR